MKQIMLEQKTNLTQEKLYEIAAFIIKQKIKKENGYSMTIHGNSMFPVFISEDKIRISESNRFHVGDIVVFLQGKVMIAHRIVKINSEEIVTKGDNNIFLDDINCELEIIGKCKYGKNGFNIQIMNFFIAKFSFWSFMLRQKGHFKIAGILKFVCFACGLLVRKCIRKN